MHVTLTQRLFFQSSLTSVLPEPRSGGGALAREALKWRMKVYVALTPVGSFDQLRVSLFST